MRKPRLRETVAGLLNSGEALGQSIHDSNVGTAEGTHIFLFILTICFRSVCVEKFSTSKWVAFLFYFQATPLHDFRWNVLPACAEPRAAQLPRGKW